MRDTGQRQLTKIPAVCPGTAPPWPGRCAVANFLCLEQAYLGSLFGEPESHARAIDDTANDYELSQLHCPWFCIFTDPPTR
jgi:hypothetical protein